MVFASFVHCVYMSTKTVFLVDDDAVALLAWQGILHASPYQVEAYQSPLALLSRLTPSVRGCVVVDLRMPSINGLELQRALQERGVELPLIFASGAADVPAAVRAMKQGAIDFLCKPIDAESLLAAIDRAMRLDTAQATARAARAAAQLRWSELTPREQSLCSMITQGLRDKQIAAELSIAASTAQVLRTRLLKKLGVEIVGELLQFMALLDQRD
jgi:FixJ family two-component response regulator